MEERREHETNPMGNPAGDKKPAVPYSRDVKRFFSTDARQVVAGFPREIAIGLKAVVILFCLVILFLPELPESFSQATNPASGAPYYLIRSHRTLVRFDHLWALIGFRHIPFMVRLLLTSLLIALSLLPGKGKPHRQEISHRIASGNRWIVPLLLFSTSTIFFLLLRIPYNINFTFADGSAIAGDVDQGMRFPAEILTEYFFFFARNVLTWLQGQATSLETIPIVSAIAGGVFVAVLWIFVRNWAVSAVERRVLFSGTLLAAYVFPFLGYIETTQWEVASMMMFFTVAFLAIPSSGSKSINWFEIGAIACVSLALLFHAAGILLIPSLLCLFLSRWDGSREKLPSSLVRRMTLQRLAAITLLILAPYFLLLVQPFFLQGNWGNIAGGGDNIMFVPLSIDYIHPVSPFVSYAMFSWWHTCDIACALFISAPFAIPLLLSATHTAYHRSITLDLWEKKFLLVLGIAAAGCLAVPLLWNHDFGMWGDWNLTATYFFPLNLFAWIAFLTVHRHTHLTSKETIGVLIPLVLAQAYATIGILGQLY